MPKEIYYQPRSPWRLTERGIGVKTDDGCNTAIATTAPNLPEQRRQEYARLFVAAPLFVRACQPRAEVTRLDWLAALITAHRDAINEPDTSIPIRDAIGTSAMLSQCEALLRELRAACAAAGIETEPADDESTDNGQAWNDQAMFEETAGRR